MDCIFAFRSSSVGLRATRTSSRSHMDKAKPAILQFSRPSLKASILWSKEQREVEEEGSVAGASLLFAGTAVGAGMLA
jgi:hypothetical protein